MRMLSVRVENVKGCELAEVKLGDRAVTVVGGANRQGKSSFLDGIAMAIGGKRLFPPDPIKEGEEEAEVVVALEGGTELIPWPCTVTRTIKRSGGGSYTTRVEIETDDGCAAPTPQTLLNGLMGKGLGFDPLAFCRQSPKDQVNTLRELVGVDFTELDHEREKLYHQRTLENRLAKEIDGKIKQTHVPDDLPSEPVSVSGLTLELQKAERHNSEIQQREAKIDQLRHRATQVQKAMMDLEREAKELADEIAKLTKGMGAKIDTSTIQADLMGAEQVNRGFAVRDEYMKLLTKRRESQASAKKLTKEIEKVDRQKQKLAAEADWPIEGLGFGPDGVVYQGTAFVQLSSSEQLNISMAIAMSLNRDFPFAIIRDGSLLDEKSLAECAKIAAERKGQVFVERVSKGAECHVIFEGGRAK